MASSVQFDNRQYLVQPLRVEHDFHVTLESIISGPGSPEERWEEVQKFFSHGLFQEEELLLESLTALRGQFRNPATEKLWEQVWDLYWL